MSVKATKLLLIDRDARTSSVLREALAHHGYVHVATVADTSDLPSALQTAEADIAIFNYRSDSPDSLSACTTVRQLRPRAAVIAIVSAGPARKVVDAWAERTGCVDLVVEKPLSNDKFLRALDGLIGSRSSLRELESKAERLSSLLPEGAVSVAESGTDPEAELFEAAVLFTDVRGSSRLIRSMPPRSFFDLLNLSLSAQSMHIREHKGAVIKYTGDGVMALFRGMGKSYLALRCALALSAESKGKELPFGIGVADGLVLAGLLGDSNHAGQRRQYDVIGATAHLAARLCAMASAGEVIATKHINVAARVTSPVPRDIGNVVIRGFDRGIDCVAFNPFHDQTGAHE